MRKGPCKKLWISPMIRYNGDVYICPKSIALCIGNINKNTLEEIWYSDRMQKIRIHEINGEFEKMPPCCHNCPGRGELNADEIKKFKDLSKKVKESVT